MVKKGERVFVKKEFQDPGDAMASQWGNLTEIGKQ